LVTSESSYCNKTRWNNKNEHAHKHTSVKIIVFRGKIIEKVRLRNTLDVVKTHSLRGCVCVLIICV